MNIKNTPITKNNIKNNERNKTTMSIENNTKEMNTVFYEIETKNDNTLRDVVNEAEIIKDWLDKLAATHHYHYLGIIGVVPTKRGRKKLTFTDDELVLYEEPRNPNTNRYIIRMVIYVNDMENFAEKLQEYLLCSGKYSFSRGKYIGNAYKTKVLGIIDKCEKLFVLDSYDEDLSTYAYTFVEDVEKIHCKIRDEQRVFLREYYGEPADDEAEEKVVR